MTLYTSIAKSIDAFQTSKFLCGFCIALRLALDTCRVLLAPHGS